MQIQHILEVNYNRRVPVEMVTPDSSMHKCAYEYVSDAKCWIPGVAGLA